MSKKIKIFLLSCALMVMCCMGITAGASEDAKANVVAHNLTITNEGINVNFYVDIQGEVQVTLDGTQVDVPEQTERIIIDAKAYNCYEFTQPVVAKQMDKKVTLVVKSGEDTLVNDSYCVNDYAKSVIDAQYNYNYEELVKAMTYYGDFAEVYLNYDAEQANEATAFLNQFDDAAKTDLINNYGMTKGDTDKGVAPTQIQLNLVSEVAIRLRFNVSDEAKSYEFKAVSEDGTKVLELKEGTDNNGTYYYVDIENIGADALDKAYAITVNDTTVLSNCSALSYARAVVKSFVDEEGNITEGKADLVNLAKALYLYNQKAKTYVSSQETAVCDIFCNGTAFYADPDFTKAVYLTDNNKDVTTEVTSNPVTALADLNGSRTKGCTIWMQTAYDVSGTEELTGPYVIRRYDGNTGNVLNVTGTATFETTVDGSEGTFVAQYPGGTTAEFTISNVTSGDVYVSGALTVKGSAKSGLITTSTADITITANGLTKDAKILFPDHTTQKLTGTGEVSAISLVDDGQEHFGAIKKSDDTLTLGSIICVCGKNVNEHGELCAWINAQTDGLEAAYNIPWKPATALPTTNGSYYLTNNLTGMNTRYQIESSNQVNLDLAGHTVQGTGNNGVIYRLKDGTLNIADSSPEQDGAIISTGSNAGQGLVVYVWGSGGGKYSYANIYGGIFQVDSVVGDDDSTVGVSNGCLNVYDGTIKGKVLVYNAKASLNIFDDAKVGIADGDKAYGIGTTDAVTSTHTINCNNVTDKASVVLKNSHDVTVSGTGDERAFSIIDKNNKVSDASGGDGIGALSIVAQMCVCGKTEEHTSPGGCIVPDTAWQPWTSTNTLPTDGSYYLTGNINDVNTRYNITGGNVLNLDLAGWRVEGIGHQDTEGATASGTIGLIYRVQQGTLNIADSSEDQIGAIHMNGETNQVGAMAVWTDTTSCMNIFGGTISANTGAAVTIRNGHVSMYGGTILPGTKPTGYAYANAVQIGTNSNSILDLKVFGGTIKGEVLISKSKATVDISGAAQVGIADDDTSKLYGIGTTVAKTINFNGANGQIVLKTLNDKGLLEVAGTGEGSAFTVLDSRNKVADLNADGIGDLTYEAYMCECGEMDGNYEHHGEGTCGKPAYAWQPWSNATSLPTTAGSYYLTTDIAVSSRTPYKGIQVNLDLAGFDVNGQIQEIDDDGTKAALIRLQTTAELNITDTEGGGVIKHAYQGTEVQPYGSVIFMPNSTDHKDACVNLYAGTLTSEGGVNNATDLVATVFIGKGTFNMYGGTVEDNLSEEADNFKAFMDHGKYNYVGGNVLEDGIYIKGGEVSTFRAGFGKTEICP